MIAIWGIVGSQKEERKRSLFVWGCFRSFPQNTMRCLSLLILFLFAFLYTKFGFSIQGNNHQNLLLAIKGFPNSLTIKATGFNIPVFIRLPTFFKFLFILLMIFFTVWVSNLWHFTWESCLLLLDQMPVLGNDKFYIAHFYPN